MAELGFEIAPSLPHIREYRDEDAAEVARCFRDASLAWPSHGPGGGALATEAIVRDGLAEWETLAFFLAWAPDRESGAERVVGYCWFTPYRDEPGVGYVHILGVHQDYHGGGYGRDLLKAALAKSVALGQRQLNLHTWAGNRRALPLYQRSGYFWAPESNVQMENYLPTIFALEPARRLFRDGLDWYRDFKRFQLGTLRPDGETYSYEWEREGRRLRVAIDRRARSVVALETDDLALSASVEGGPAPVGSERPVVLRVASRRPAAVGLVADGRDGVALRLAESATVEGTREWRVPATVERAGDGRVDATAIVDGEPWRLGLTVRGVEPIAVSFDRQRWLRPGLAQSYWVTVTNQLEEPVAGTLRVVSAPGLSIDRDELTFELGPRERAGLRLCVSAAAPGSYALRARAAVAVGQGETREGAWHDGFLHCGAPGALLVEQTPDSVAVAADGVVLEVPLPGSRWGSRLVLLDRASGKQLMEHACVFGRPFFPAFASTGGLRARVDREEGAVTLVLSALAPRVPGVSLDWIVRVAASGLVRLTYRVANGSGQPRTLSVGSTTHAELAPAASTRSTIPLASGLVDEPSVGFPDWFDETHIRPERYAESWLAKHGDGWVAATIWERSEEVVVWWSEPALAFDLGTIPPGGRAETPPVYLYAGPGDWRTARRLWRSLVAPDAPAEDPIPRPAHHARLERFVGTDDALETRVVLASERAWWRTGNVTLEVQGETVAAGEVDGLRAWEPRAVPARVPLAARPGARAGSICFEHALSTDEYPVALIRAGDGQVTPTVRSGQADDMDVVRIDNGVLGLTLVPSQVGRIAELNVDGVNQLLASWPESGTLVRYGSWFGGIHPVLAAEGATPWSYPGTLIGDQFAWEEVERTGGQGVRWRGVRVATEPTAPELRGLRLGVEYLVTGAGNLLAMTARLENRGRAAWRGRLELASYLQPGGDRRAVELTYLGDGERQRRRVHGETYLSSSNWCALVSPTGPTLALVAASPGAEVRIFDAGLEGAHPYLARATELEPGRSVDAVAYLVVAASLEQARLYRHLSEAGGLV